jgi:hypothetical protein
MPGLVNTVHLRTLQRALETPYMAGKEIVPIPVFIAALDIVALRNGHARKPER